MKKEPEKPGNEEDEDAKDDTDGDIDEKTGEQADDDELPFGENLDEKPLDPDEQLMRQIRSLTEHASRKQMRDTSGEQNGKSKASELPLELDVTPTTILLDTPKKSVNISPGEGKEEKKDDKKKAEKKKEEKIGEDKKEEKQPDTPVKKNVMATPLDPPKKHDVAERVKEEPAEADKEKLKKKAASMEQAKRLEKIKRKMKKSDKNKRVPPKKKTKGRKKKSEMKESTSDARKARKRTSKQEEVKKKTLGEKIRDQLQVVRSALTGAKAGKAQKNAQVKLTKKNARLGNVAEGDDLLPQIGVIKERDVDDGWIEDPAVLTDRSHRADLVLVSNNENGGQLWHENVRPFWRNKALQKEVPPIPSEKTVSKLLLDVIANKVPIAEPPPDPTGFINPLLPFDAMSLKDDLWFKEQQILGNTIRSIVGALNDSEQEMGTKRGGLDSQDMRKIIFNEPSTLISYYRHNNTKRETAPFTKSATGKLRKLKKGGSPSSSSMSITPPSSPNGSITGAMTDSGHSPDPKKRGTTTKDKAKLPDQERSGIKKVDGKKKA